LWWDEIESITKARNRENTKMAMTVSLSRSWRVLNPVQLKPLARMRDEVM
jgi:hypothetical protein